MDRSVIKVILGFVIGGFVAFVGGFFAGGIGAASANLPFFINAVNHGLALCGWGMVAGTIGGAAIAVVEALKTKQP